MLDSISARFLAAKSRHVIYSGSDGPIWAVKLPVETSTCLLAWLAWKVYIDKQNSGCEISGVAPVRDGSLPSPIESSSKVARTDNAACCACGITWTCKFANALCKTTSTVDDGPLPPLFKKSCSNTRMRAERTKISRAVDEEEPPFSEETKLDSWRARMVSKISSALKSWAKVELGVN